MSSITAGAKITGCKCPMGKWQVLTEQDISRPG
jgi:hypothetical protein